LENCDGSAVAFGFFGGEATESKDRPVASPATVLLGKTVAGSAKFKICQGFLKLKIN